MKWPSDCSVYYTAVWAFSIWIFKHNSLKIIVYKYKKYIMVCYFFVKNMETTAYLRQ